MTATYERKLWAMKEDICDVWCAPGKGWDGRRTELLALLDTLPADEIEDSHFYRHREEG
jgi:hypothetical protein